MGQSDQEHANIVVGFPYFIKNYLFNYIKIYSGAGIAQPV
jgi:hypothetical protein